MAENLKEFSRMRATGIGNQDLNNAEGGQDREGPLGDRAPTSIVATGKRNGSIRKGMSLESRSEGKR
jgi:hypothetical protein